MDEIRVCLALAIAEHKSMHAFAHRYDINAGNLHQVLTGRRAPQAVHLAILGVCRKFEQVREPQC